MGKKYQVFVSSTYEDLIDERKSAIQALLENDCIPLSMELFPAANEDQWTFIKKVISDCDYFVLVLAGKYGSCSDQTGVSYTEMEYMYALELGMPVISFLHENVDLLSESHREIDGEKIARLNDFRELVGKKLCNFWSTDADLKGAIGTSIRKLIRAEPAVGWIKADHTLAKDVLLPNNFIDDLKEILVENVRGVTELSENAYKSGISKIHISRNDIVHDIKKLVKTAKNKILISGTSLSEGIKLEDLAPGLKEKILSDCKVKVLLHNPMGRTALLRSLFELEKDVAHSILNTSLGTIDNSHPYFDLPLYERFTSVLSLINRKNNNSLREKIRFFDLLPSYWLIIVDNVAFVQPYVLENVHKGRSELCAFTPMPIFEFHRSLNRDMFCCLEEHFENIYTTSDFDAMYLGVLNKNRGEILKGVYQTYKDWINNFKYNLKNPSDQRVFPRHRCMLKSSSLELDAGSKKVKVNKIVDYSQAGMLLRLSENLALTKGDKVRLFFDGSNCTEEEKKFSSILNLFAVDEYVISRDNKSDSKKVALSV